MRCRRAAFTIIELFVVIALISLLMMFSIGVSLRMLGAQERRNTENSMNKLASLLRQDLSRVIDEVKAEMIPATVMTLAGGEPQRARVLYIKMRLKQQFPMSFAEALDPAPGHLAAEPAYVRALTASPDGPYLVSKHKQSTEMGACLYLALTARSRGGSADIADLLSALDKLDTDKDGVTELVDAWQVPLGFFRCPYDAPVPPLVSSPPYPPPAQAAPPFLDPEDPSGTLQPGAWPATFNTVFGHAPLNRLVYPLIVSAGPDGSERIEQTPASLTAYLGYSNIWMAPVSPSTPIDDNIVVPAN